MGPALTLIVLIAYSQPSNRILVERGPAMANGVCDSIQAALRIDDLDYANSLVHNWLVSLAPTYPSIRVHPSELLPPEAAFQADIHQTAAEFCNEIRVAFSANDPTKGYVAGVKLRTVLERLVADLPASPQAKFDRMEKAVSQLNGLPRFYRLVGLAKAAPNANDLIKARTYGDELLKTAARYLDNWNYGNALYFGNWTLGRVALHEPPGRSFSHFLDRLLGRAPPLQGDLKRAGMYLLRAAAAPPGPAGLMNTFGPNTMLAKELLERGQSKVVLRYFVLCAKYWKMDYGRLADWTAAVKRGAIPDFGASLNY